jgi:hypothetical protein
LSGYALDCQQDRTQPIARKHTTQGVTSITVRISSRLTGVKNASNWASLACPGSNASWGEDTRLPRFACALYFLKFLKFRAIAARKADPVLFDRFLQALLIMGAVKITMGVNVAVSQLFV